jgi:biotin synthase
MRAEQLIDKLNQDGQLPKEELLELIRSRRELSGQTRAYLYHLAKQKAEACFGHDIYVRGLIEFTNYCRNDCLYCGIRRDSGDVRRYRLTKEEILACADEGRRLGFMTFVLQGGEDPYYTDDRICDIVRAVKTAHPDCAITLSVGERERESFQRFFDAGADRYLLRHETADETHYRFMHPEELSLAHRMKCLFDLKEIGFQVGAGFMVGSPGQTDETLVSDFQFLRELDPEMIGIGPFIPQHATPFKDYPAGTLEDTLFFLALLRLHFPKAMLPATTALGSIHPKGREMGVLAGANVIMPNLSPGAVRKDYLLYDGKICIDDDAGHCRGCIGSRMHSIGYEIVESRGDAPGVSPAVRPTERKTQMA